VNRLLLTLEIVGGLAVGMALPVVTLWLAAPLSAGCASSWSFWNLFTIPNYCSFTLSPLVFVLTLPTYVLVLAALLRKAWFFALTLAVVGSFVWYFLITSFVLTGVH
jgi:hypothetical protein